MAGYSIITHKGREILYFDQRGLSGKELLENIKNCDQFIKNYNGAEALTLANFMDTYADEEVMNYLKSEESLEINKKVKKAAVVGITGIKKILLNAYNTFTGGKYKAFDSEEDAEEYLIS